MGLLIAALCAFVGVCSGYLFCVGCWFISVVDGGVWQLLLLGLWLCWLCYNWSLNAVFNSVVHCYLIFIWACLLFLFV